MPLYDEEKFEIGGEPVKSEAERLDIERRSVDPSYVKVDV